jgi:hypothetical protein
MSSSIDTPNTWYTGSCHCGAVRYSVALDLSNPSFEATKCNCSICLKTNRLGVRIPDPEQSFKLLSPASLDDVPAYRFATKQSQHRFCNKCGIHLLCHGEYEYEGQVHKIFSINAVTLDPDQEGLDLREWKVRFWDGKKENWNAGPAEKPYPGGSYY